MVSKNVLHLSVIIVLLLVSVTGFAQTKVVVIPLAGDDVPIVPTSKTIFVTSATYNGNLGGISGADDKCQAEADAANVPGIFRAWLSTDITEDIPDRASFIKHDLPYNNVNGDNVANNFDDFLDDDFNSIIDRVSTPDDIGLPIWTGTFFDGSGLVHNCNGWTDGTVNVPGYLGNSSGGVGGSFWSGGTFFGCHSDAHLYCFEQ